MATKVQRGSALVESVILLPLLLLMLAVFFQLAILLAADLDISLAAREGARLASLLKPIDTDDQNVKNKVATELYLGRMYGDSISVRLQLSDGPSLKASNGVPCAQEVTVVVSVTPFFPAFRLLGFKSPQLSHRRSMRYQHQPVCDV